MFITSQEIEKAKLNVCNSDPQYGHNDRIRIAYEWLDAQKKTKTQGNCYRGLKEYIERWGDRYVTQSDVEVAAYLHPDITGEYPCFNLISGLIEPSIERLKNFEKANSHGKRKSHRTSAYQFKERSFKL